MATSDKSSKDKKRDSSENKNQDKDITPSNTNSWFWNYFLKNALVFIPSLISVLYVPKSFAVNNPLPNQDIVTIVIIEDLSPSEKIQTKLLGVDKKYRKKLRKLNLKLDNFYQTHLDNLNVLRQENNPHISSLERKQFKKDKQIYEWWLRGPGNSSFSIEIQEQRRVKLIELSATIELKSKYFRLQSAIFDYKRISHLCLDELKPNIKAYNTFSDICISANDERAEFINSLNNMQKSELFLSYNLIGIVDEQTFDLNQFQQKMASLFEKQVRNRDKISEIFLQNVSYVKDIGFIPSTSEQIIYLGKLNLLIEENTIMIDSLKTESEELKQSYINMNDSVVELARSFRISTSEFYI